MIDLSPVADSTPGPVIFTSLHALGEAMRQARAQPAQVPPHLRHLLHDHRRHAAPAESNED